MLPLRQEGKQRGVTSTASKVRLQLIERKGTPSRPRVLAAEQGRQLQAEPRHHAPTRREGPSTAHQAIEEAERCRGKHQEQQNKQQERRRNTRGIPAGVPSSNAKKKLKGADIGGSLRADPSG
jgi:hypothetical protein